MPYINLHSKCITPLEQHIDVHWQSPLLKSASLPESFFYKEVLSRGAHFFVLMPGSVITCALDTLIGCMMGFGAICTLGLHPKILRYAVNHLNNSRYILAAPYTHLIHTVNPKAQFKRQENENGFITAYVYKHLGQISSSCRDSQDVFVRHVFTRLTYVLMAIACVITRIVDFIIGIVAAIFSLVTLGSIDWVNNAAYRGLQVTGIVDDLFMCTIKCINPWATIQTSAAR